MTPVAPGGPLGSVVIPAHQEASRIGRCLSALADGWRPGQLDVVVVSNGSTDGTAEAAKHAAAALGLAVRVVERPEPGKMGAIREGERLTSAPRLYLDADVRLTSDSAAALLRSVAAGSGRDVAVPRRVLDVSGCTGPARVYHRFWEGLPWVRSQLSGRGAYALSPSAAERFGSLGTELVADDRLATSQAEPARVAVVDVPAVVPPAATVRQLVTARRRIYAGNDALAAAHLAPRHDMSRAGRALGLARWAAPPRRWPGLLVWAGVTATAKVLSRRSAHAWRLEGPAGAGPLTPAGPAVRSLSVVVVTFRSAATIEACLGALRRAVPTAGVPVDVVVVDNASDDDTLRRVDGAAGAWVRVVRRAVNDGFGRACNEGAGGATGDLVLFCNPDVEVAPDALQAVVLEASRRPGAGIIGGQQLGRDGLRSGQSWWWRPTWWSTVCFAVGLTSLRPDHRLFDPEQPGEWDGGSQDVDAVSGAFLAIRRPVLTALGGFDERYLLYGEDLDLCLRARAAGQAVRVCGAATYVHDEGASSRATAVSAEDLSTARASRLQLVLRGRAAVLRRHLGPPAVWLLQGGVLVRSLAAPRAASSSGRRVTTPRSAWLVAWRARADWARGWPDGDDLGAVVARSRAAAVHHRSIPA